MINLYYCTDANFGDAMSPIVVSKLSGQKVRPSSMWNADMMAIGSVFFGGHDFMVDFTNARFLRKVKAIAWRFHRVSSRRVIVWGSGFLQYPHFFSPCVMRRFRVAALRGCCTRKILESYKILSSGEKIVYGDPGLLYARLHSILHRPTYDLGVILHKCDANPSLNNRFMESLTRYGIDVRLIDITDTPSDVVAQIASCERIISSSLHGLVVADSLCIPNMHVGVSMLNLGKLDFELKFRDYYSAYNIKMPSVVAVDDLLKSPQKYLTNGHFFRLDRQMVEETQARLLHSFPTLIA